MPESDLKRIPDTAFSGEAMRRFLSRRQMLGTLGLGAASLIIADNSTTESIWSDDETRVNVYETGGVQNGDMWVVLGGLGVQDSTDILKSLSPSLKTTGQYAASVRYSDTGLNVEAVTDGVNRAAHKLGVEVVHLYCHSMSNTMVPDILPNLDKRLRVGMYMLDCPPWTKRYVYDEDIVAFLGALPIGGSYASKLAAQTYDRFCRPQVEDLSFPEKWGVIWQQVNDRVSPKTWTGQIKYLDAREESDYGVIPENARSSILVPHELGSDTTVLLPQVVEAYPNIFPGFRSIMRVAAEGHAAPRQHSREYIEAINEVSLENRLVFSTGWDIQRRHAGQIRSFDT